MKSNPLPADDAAQAKLQETLNGLTLQVPEGSAIPVKTASKTFTFSANDRKLESLALEESDCCTTMVVRVNGKEQRIECGHGAWKKGRAAWGTLPEQPVAAAGAWTAEDTFTTKVCLTETPFVQTIKVKFTGDEVKYDVESNVGFGATKASPLTGKAKP
jgi:hypothetical protein